MFRFHAVIDSGKHHMRPYQYMISQINASLILKMTAAVDKHILSDKYIFPAVRIKRRKHRKRFIHQFSR